MLIELSPLVFNFIFASLFGFIGGAIGYTLNKNSRDDIIENTIVYLIENNFLKAKKVNGELEILKLDDEE